MSRCFPFPPPGYERKTKADEPDLLQKEKHREKKHKKDKREKEKLEGKEKREKERKDEKHREKKDKKEKHRDKKKDKEKDREKDKHKSSSLPLDEKRVVVGSAGGRPPLPSEKSKDIDNDRSGFLAEKRVAGVSAFRNGEQVSKSNHLSPENKSIALAPETKSFRHAPELGRRITDDERRIPDKNVGTESKKDVRVAKLAGRSVSPAVDVKEKSKEKAALDGRMDGRVVAGEPGSSGSALVPNSVGMVLSIVGGAARAMETKVDRRVELKEKIRDKDGENRKGEKRKEKDRENLIHKDKDKDREKEKKKDEKVKVKSEQKEKKKDEKVKVKSEQKHVEQSRIRDSSANHMVKPNVKDENRKELPSAQNVGVQNVQKDANHGAVANNILGKRKDIGLNGIYDEQITGPNKLARTMASTRPLMENGRSLEPCQNSAALRPPMNIKVERTFAPDDTQRPPTSIKVDDGRINGIISQPSSQQSSQVTLKAERKPPNAPPKPPPPHPDAKYLSQVLSVPKLDEWSDFDDQEWLFNSRTSRLEVQSSEIDQKPLVWDKTLWLEPVDIHALPYVIPH